MQSMLHSNFSLVGIQVGVAEKVSRGPGSENIVRAIVRHSSNSTVVPLSHWYAWASPHFGHPISKTLYLVIWTSPVTLTLTQTAKVIQYEKGMPISLGFLEWGCPSQCNTASLPEPDLDWTARILFSHLRCSCV